MDSVLHREWELEAKALGDISGLGHEHMIQVKSIIKKGPRHYFLFPWADGGSLQDYYTRNLQPELTAALLQDIVKQLRGLADAIKELHNFHVKGSMKDMDRGTRDQSYRHGDLKPDNILVFSDVPGTIVGMWKIADMGLAKHHVASTNLRVAQPTSTRFGTRIYEPPEVITKSAYARSRRYDIWSMGCIIFELIIWLMYGFNEVRKFNMCRKSSLTDNDCPYWELWKKDEARVHHKVKEMMDRMKKDLESSGTGPTALGDLIRLVENKLMVVALSRDTDTFAIESPENDRFDQIVISTKSPSTVIIPASAPSVGKPDQMDQPMVMVTGPAGEPSLDDIDDTSAGPFRCKAEDFLQGIEDILSETDTAYWLTDLTGTQTGTPSTLPNPEPNAKVGFEPSLRSTRGKDSLVQPSMKVDVSSVPLSACKSSGAFADDARWSQRQNVSQ